MGTTGPDVPVGGIRALVDEVYAAEPKEKLFHYTSIGAALSIVTDGVMRATDIRYMSDASELANSAKLIVRVAAEHVHSGAGNAEILSQFGDWVTHRLTEGHSVFVACFSERGNLLSQWRGYCPDGKGVSLGFRPADLAAAAKAQNYSLVSCVYGHGEQVKLLHQVVLEVDRLAKAAGKSSQRHPDNSYHPVFESVENDLLRLAAALKHGAFFEEQEWRVISEISTRPKTDNVKYREGKSTLVPYKNFLLPRTEKGELLLPHAFVGPTPHPSLAVRSLGDLLSTRVAGQFQVGQSQIPYRTW